MELRQVRYFLALSRTLNFTRAAEEVNVTQPTLTASIKKLEDELGGDLINRNGRHTHLTHLGRTLLPFLEQVFESSQAVAALANDIARGERNVLHLGVCDVFDAGALTEPLREVFAQVDGLELCVEHGPDHELYEMLATGNLDMVVLDSAGLKDSRMEFSALYKEDITLLMSGSHALAARASVRADDLNRHPLVNVDRSLTYSRFLTEARAAQVTCKTHNNAKGHVEAQIIASSGMALALAGPHEPVIGGLVRRSLDGLNVSRTIGVAVFRGRSLNVAAMLLEKLLRSQSYVGAT